MNFKKTVQLFMRFMQY